MYFSFPSGHSAAAGMLLNIILMLRVPPDEPHSDCSVPHSRHLFEYSCEICIHSLASLTPLVHLFTDLFPWRSRRYSDWSDSCRRSPYSLSFFIARSSSHYHWYLCRSQSWYKLFILCLTALGFMIGYIVYQFFFKLRPTTKECFSDTQLFCLLQDPFKASSPPVSSTTPTDSELTPVALV